MAKERQINIGMIGMGTVGTGVAKHLEKIGDQHNILLKKVAVADISKPRSVNVQLTDNPREILNDPNIDIVVEVMGGKSPAKDYILEAIDKRKSVVTANKAALAGNMVELFSAASLNNVDLAFEASVGGSIPIINRLQRLRGENIDKIMGILNGTTNFMLTQMEGGKTYKKALLEAQKSGFAEADPTLDVNGSDVRDKIAILSSIIFNTQVLPENIPTRGITEITPADHAFAEQLGHKIKLVAVAKREESGEIDIHVNPALIKNSHKLAAIQNEMNAVYLEPELAGGQILSGKGAGSEPTASAVISDIIDLADNIRKNSRNSLPTLDEKVVFANPASVEQQGYIRIELKHIPRSFSIVSGILADYGLNLNDSVQMKKNARQTKHGLIIPDMNTLESAPRGALEAALKAAAKSDRVYGKPVFIPFEG
jgi:homoserine dehydrogenase